MLRSAVGEANVVETMKKGGCTFGGEGNGGIVHGLVERIKTTIVTEATPNTVVALMGVGSLFGLARVSSIVEGIKDTVGGRLVVFFPGEYHPENHAYRLLDARDGWNYLAVPLLAKEA